MAKREKQSESLPRGWAQCTVGDLASYVNGRAFMPSEWKDVGRPIIRIQNLNDPAAPYNYSPEAHEVKYRIQRGDLLFAWSASLGAYIWDGEEAWLNQHIFRVDLYDGVEKRYVYYLLDKITAELYAKAHGSGMVHVTKGKFEENSVDLPPTAEQIRIVSKIDQLISELDQGIENLQTARGQLEVYRQALLKHAFEGKLTQNWREENEGKLTTPEKLLERIKLNRKERYGEQVGEWKLDVKEWEKNGKSGKRPSKPRAPKALDPLCDTENKDLANLPNGWSWDHLGWMTCGVEYGTSAKSSEAGDVPVLRMGNIQNGKFDWSDLVYTSDKEEIAKYDLAAGDVLFNRTNSPELVGKTAVYRGERQAIFAGYLIRVNQNPAVVDSQYLNLYLNSYTAKKHGNQVKTDGVNQSNINGEKTSKLSFPVLLD